MKQSYLQAPARVTGFTGVMEAGSTLTHHCGSYIIPSLSFISPDSLPPLSASHISMPAGCILSMYVCVGSSQSENSSFSDFCGPPHVQLCTFLLEDAQTCHIFKRAHASDICNCLIQPFWGLSLFFMLKFNWIISFAPSLFICQSYCITGILQECQPV